jgi:hypothetical protein
MRTKKRFGPLLTAIDKALKALEGTDFARHKHIKALKTKFKEFAAFCHEAHVITQNVDKQEK